LSQDIVLIDLENVQPKNLELLVKHPFKVLVFVGANQAKISFDLASAMQGLGPDSQYIKISGNGPNALDFHIAYYIGELAQQFPESNFHIISRDTGFDPLIRHLRSRKIRVQREKDLAEIPENIKNRLNIHPVKWIDQVLDLALERKPNVLPVVASAPVTNPEVTKNEQGTTIKH